RLYQFLALTRLNINFIWLSPHFPTLPTLPLLPTPDSRLPTPDSRFPTPEKEIQ
ncbi:MAG: hypothetical protein F6J94_30705, partial [Moorea sp. SIO1F2]|nr:hypothetical protein [Moorena sp. SIO1F2]